jgi:hypothetical protein
MRGISREVLARDAAWTLDDGNCKDLTQRWAAWENAYLAAKPSPTEPDSSSNPPPSVPMCPITTECADLAQLSGYTGIAAGSATATAPPTPTAPATPSPAPRSQRERTPAGQRHPTPG